MENQIVDLVLEADELFTCNNQLSTWVILSLVCDRILAIGMERISPIVNGLFFGSGFVYQASLYLGSNLILTPVYLNALIYWVTLLLNSTLSLIPHVETFLQGDILDAGRARLILEFLTEFLRTHTFIFGVLNRLCIVLEHWNIPQSQQLLDLVDELRETGNQLYSLYRNLEEVLGIAAGASALPVEDWEL